MAVPTGGTEREPRTQPLPSKTAGAEPQAAQKPIDIKVYEPEPQTGSKEPSPTKVPEQAKTPKIETGAHTKPEQDPWKRLVEKLKALFKPIEAKTQEETPSTFLQNLWTEIEAETVSPDKDPEAYLTTLAKYKDKLDEARKRGDIDKSLAYPAIRAINREAVLVVNLYRDSLAEEFIQEILRKKFGQSGGTPPPALPGTAPEIDREAEEDFAEDMKTGHIDDNHLCYIWENEQYRDAYIDQAMRLQDALPSTPSSEYAGSIYIQSIKDQFMLLLSKGYTKPRITPPPRVADDAERSRKLLSHYGSLLEVRRTLHDMAVVAETGEAEDLSKYIEFVQSQKFDLMMGVSGVDVAIRAYEYAWKLLRLRRGGTLPASEIVFNFRTQKSELDEIARKMVVGANERKEIARLNDRRKPSNYTEPLTIREIDRALALGRSFMLVTLRAEQHVAKSLAPADSNRYLASFYSEKIARHIEPIRWLIQRFGIGKDQTAKTVGILAYPLDYHPTFLFSKDRIIRSIYGKGVDDFAQRLMDLMNLTDTGDFLTGSDWRDYIWFDEMTDKEAENAGFTTRLMMARKFASKIVEEEIRDEVGTDKFEREHYWEKEYYRKRVGDKINDLLMRRFTYDIKTPDGSVRRTFVHQGNRELVRQLAHRSPLSAISLLSEIDGDSRQKIFTAAGITNPDLMTETELDLAMISEHRMNTDFTSDTLDFTVINDSTREARAQGVYTSLLDFLAPTHPDGYLEKLARKKWEYAPTFEDINWKSINFAAVGPRGMARKIADHVEHKKGWIAITDLLIALPDMKDSDQIADYLKSKVWEPFSHYNAAVAHRMIYQLAMGIGMFYRKDYKATLPLFGTLYGFRGRSSVAEDAYGRDAMAWDERDMHHFIHALLARGAISREQAEQLAKNLGATKINRVSWWARGSLALTIFGWLQNIFEEAKKPIKV